MDKMGESTLVVGIVVVGIAAGTVTERTIEEECMVEGRSAEERMMGQAYTAKVEGHRKETEEHRKETEERRKETEERSFGESQQALEQDYRPGRPKLYWEMKPFSYYPSIHQRRP